MLRSLQTRPTFETLTGDARRTAAAARRCALHQGDSRHWGIGGREGEAGEDGGEEEEAKVRPCSAGRSGAVAVSVSATAASSSSPCPVGRSLLCVAV